MIEVWKTCGNAPYEVSNLGNVRRVSSTQNRKPILLKNGYLTIMFSIEGKVYCKYVHRLVADAFIANPNNLPEINHINRNRRDNRVENLEWCDRLYNIQDAVGKILLSAMKMEYFLNTFLL